MTKTFNEPDITSLSSLERLSIDDRLYYQPSAIGEDRVYASASNAPTKSPHLRGAKRLKLSLGAPLFEAWLKSPLSFDSWNPLKAAWDRRHHNESKYPPKSSVCDYIDSDSIWKSTIDGSSTDSVTGESVFKNSEQLHIPEEPSILETTRLGTAWPSIKLLGSRSQVEPHVKTDGPLRKSRLGRFKFPKRPSTEAGLNPLPPTRSTSQGPLEVKIKEEFKDDFNVGGSDISAALPIYVSSHSLELVEKSSLEMVNLAKQEEWHCLSEIDSAETDSESSRSEICSVGDDDDIFRTLPNKLLAQIFSDEDLSDLGVSNHSSGKGAKGKGTVPPVKSGESSRLAQGYSKGPSTNGRKRKCLNSEDGNEEEDEDNIRDTKKEKLQTTWPPQLCPVFVANPSHPDFRPDGKFSLCTKHVPKIPQHMKRYHIKPAQCNNCGFRGDTGQVKDHEETTTCQRKLFDPVPPADKEKENLLKKKRGSPWCEVFKIQMGSDVSNYSEAAKYVACRDASSDFSRSFANYLKPKWESIIKGYYESSDYKMFSEKHPGVDFGPNNPSRPRSKIENIFVEGFLFPGRPPRAFETPTITPKITPPPPPTAAADNYPTPVSASSSEKGGTTPSSQASPSGPSSPSSPGSPSSPSSPQTGDMPQTAPQLSAPVQTVDVQTNCLAAQDLSLISWFGSPQRYDSSLNNKPPPALAADQTSAAHIMSFDHRRLSASNIPGTIERNDSSHSSAQYPVESTFRVSSEQPDRYNVPMSGMPATTSHSSLMALNEFISNELPSVHGELNKKSISNVDGAQYLDTPPGLGDCSPVYSQGLRQLELFSGFGDASERAPSTCVAHEAFTQTYANSHNMYSYPLKDPVPPESSHYQQALLFPNGRPLILPSALGYDFSTPSESSFKHQAAPQLVAYEQSGLSCLYCVLDASDGRSAAFNGHAEEWDSHQGNTQLFGVSVPDGAVGTQKNICKYTHGDSLTSMASLNSAESQCSVAGIGSSSNGNTGSLPGLSCTESGIQYLYKNGETVGQANSIEANNWEYWSDGAGEIA